MKILAGLSARLLRRLAKRGDGTGNTSRSSRRYKTSKRKYRMYRSIWG